MKPMGENNIPFLKENNVVHCRNYDKKLHKRGWWAQSSFSDDLELHTMAPDDLRVAVVGSPPPKKEEVR